MYQQVCALQWSDTYRELVSSHGFSDNQLCLWQYPTMTKVRYLLHTHVHKRKKENRTNRLMWCDVVLRVAARIPGPFRSRASHGEVSRRDDSCNCQRRRDAAVLAAVQRFKQLCPKELHRSGGVLLFFPPVVCGEPRVLSSDARRGLRRGDIECGGERGRCVYGDEHKVGVSDPQVGGRYIAWLCFICARIYVYCVWICIWICAIALLLYWLYRDTERCKGGSNSP